jgi:ribosomal protein S18 acetylase RimI-like enzyme
VVRLAFEDPGFVTHGDTREVAAVIRTARPGDGAGLARVHIETWQAAYKGQLPDEFLDGMTSQLEQRTAWWERMIASAADRRWTQFVAEDADSIVGFATCGPAEGDDADPHVGQVYAIYVHPRGWRKGIGRQLFERAAEVLREAGYSTAVLWVLGTNTRARRFYEAAGWQPDGGTRSETRGEVVLHEVRYRAVLAPEGSS